MRVSKYRSCLDRNPGEGNSRETKRSELSPVKTHKRQKRKKRGEEPKRVHSFCLRKDEFRRLPLSFLSSSPSCSSYFYWCCSCCCGFSHDPSSSRTGLDQSMIEVSIPPFFCFSMKKASDWVVCSLLHFYFPPSLSPHTNKKGKCYVKHYSPILQVK